MSTNYYITATHPLAGTVILSQREAEAIASLKGVAARAKNVTAALRGIHVMTNTHGEVVAEATNLYVAARITFRPETPAPVDFDAIFDAAEWSKMIRTGVEPCQVDDVYPPVWRIIAHVTGETLPMDMMHFDMTHFGALSKVTLPTAKKQPGQWRLNCTDRQRRYALLEHAAGTPEAHAEAVIMSLVDKRRGL